MYQPAHFRLDDTAALHALIAAHPLATLVVPTAQGLEINHLPLRLDATGTQLIGHVARANALWTLAPTGPVAAVFHGPQAYITPQWYAGKAVHGKEVPTWNYAVVHVHGRLRWIHAGVDDGDAALHALLQQLTDANEAAHGQALVAAGHAAPTAWRVDDAPADYVAAMRRAIVGLELTIERIDGKRKASQNKDAGDRARVVAGLTARGEIEAAALVGASLPTAR